MEYLHVKIDYVDALDTKKTILNCEIGILNSLRRLKNYKNLRKRELALKKELKEDIDFVYNKIKITLGNLPQQQNYKNNKDEINWDINEPREIIKELEDIKRKLERLQN